MRDPIPTELRNDEKRDVKIYQMKYKQRERLIDKIDRWTEELASKYQNAKSKRTQKDIEKKQIEATIIRTNLNSINNDTKLFDSGNRNSVYKYEDILSKPVRGALKEIQKSGHEYAGGINIESKDNPEKIVVRKGTKKESKQDFTCDIVLHSHPDRKIVGHFDKEEEYLDNLYKKAKNEKEKTRIEKLKFELNAPYDYLASAQDIRVMNNLDKNQTQLVLSKNRVNVMTRREEKVIDNVDEEYHEKLMKLAATRTITHQPKNLKEAERMISNYRKEIKKGYKSFTDNYGIDAEINQNHYIPYRLQKENLRQSRRQYVPEEKYLMTPGQSTYRNKNNKQKQVEKSKKVEKSRKIKHIDKNRAKKVPKERNQKSESNWFTRLFH